MNQDYANEMLAALEAQRNAAMTAAADAQAKCAMVRAQLAALIKRIQEKGLMEHFVDPAQPSSLPAEDKSPEGETG